VGRYHCGEDEGGFGVAGEAVCCQIVSILRLE